MVYVRNDTSTRTPEERRKRAESLRRMREGYQQELQALNEHADDECRLYIAFATSAYESPRERNMALAHQRDRVLDAERDIVFCERCIERLPAVADAIEAGETLEEELYEQPLRLMRELNQRIGARMQRLTGRVRCWS